LSKAHPDIGSLAPQIVLCAGLKSSGSTWLYNAIIRLCESSAQARRISRARIMPFYAESIEQFPSGAERALVLVVKTHIPSPSLVFLTRFTRGTAFVTVREPRDAVASLMQRFGHRFEPCLKEVAAGSERVLDIARTLRPLVLRYESRFFARSQTIHRLSARLQFDVPKETAERICRELSAGEVTKKIARLAARGTFGKSPDPDRFEPRTHWHPGHVGDRKIGKFAEVLTPRMQQAVLKAMPDYCRFFGYAAEIRSRGHRGGGVRKSNRIS
jgi:hypothetical protein